MLQYCSSLDWLLGSQVVVRNPWAGPSQSGYSAILPCAGLPDLTLIN